MRGIGGMLVRTLATFDRWVREPVDPRPMCWFRCWFGALSLVNLLLLWPDMPMWLADEGVLPPAVHRPALPGASITLYSFGAGTAAIALIRCLGLVGGLGLLLGIVPRCAAACTWLAVTSYSWRNPLILHSGDALLRIAAFFLIFARTDAVLSVPRWLTRRGGAAGGPPLPPAPVPAWPQRILQLQLCILYLVTGIWKSCGPAWRDGSAVGIVLQMGEFQRLPVPDLVATPMMSQLLTWATLAFELGFPFLVWLPRTRLPLLAIGLGFHAGLEWMLNVQLFQWTITAFYLLFLRPPATHAAITTAAAQEPAAGRPAAKAVPVRTRPPTTV